MSAGPIPLIEIGTRRPYLVQVGPGVLENLEAWVHVNHAGARCAVLTDRHLEELHAGALGPLASHPRLVLDPGEGSKSFASLERVLEFLCASGLERDSLLIAFGGGVIGDLAGLAASLYMRGIAVLHCPTTLLAQVDSSIGGKTAINLSAGKNLAGSFHQPCAVFADTRLLATLSELEFRSGLGELLKTALVGDAELFGQLETRGAELLARDPALLAELVRRCVTLKGAIVVRDEREAGERKKLNLGHTFAHGIEHAAGFGEIPHGEAVATGLQLACELARQQGLLEDASLPERLRMTLLALGLSPDLDSLRARFGVRLTREDLERGMQHDKKSSSGRLRFVLPLAIGKLAIDQDLPSESWRALL